MKTPLNRAAGLLFMCLLTALCGTTFVVSHSDTHPCACDPAECRCEGHRHGAHTAPTQKAESCHLPNGGASVPAASLAWTSDCGTANSGVFVLFEHAAMCPDAVVWPSPLTRDYGASCVRAGAAQNIVFPEIPPPKILSPIS